MSAFPKSPWTLIAALADPSTEAVSRELAIKQFCELYSAPIFAFVERFYPSADAGDITQEVFAYTLEKDLLEKADRERGKLRTYLIQIIKGVASKNLRREGRQNRPLPFDVEACRDFAAGFTGMAEDEPERHFDTLFARQTFRRSLAAVESSYIERGQDQIVRVLIARSLGEGSEGAEGLGLSEGALRVQLHRFRQRLKEAFVKEVAVTVQGREIVEEEVNYLLQLLSKRGTF